MEIGEYLHGIAKCPNILACHPNPDTHIPALTKEFGVYDNFAILMRGGYHEVLNCLEGAGFNASAIQKSEGNVFVSVSDPSFKTETYVYRPRVTRELLLSKSTLGSTWVTDRPKNRTLISHVRRQVHNYDSLMVIHPSHHSEREPLLHRVRAVASQIRTLSEVLVKNNVPFCFPQSRGWGHRGEFTRLVYHEPQNGEAK